MSTKLLDFPTQHAKKAVSEITAKENFISFKTTVTAGSSKGDNYLGEMYRVKIDGTKKDGSITTISLILKNAPQSAERRKNMDVKSFFIAEINAYQTILPALTKVQQNSSLKETEKFRFIKCHHCCTEELNEMLIMEDMAVDGFVMYHDRKISLDMPHASKVIEKLAQFHALSFVLKKRDLSSFKSLVSKSEEQIFTKKRNDNIASFIKIAHDKAVESIENALHREKLQIFSADLFEQICKLMEPDLENPFYALCHGDSWTNNFLFKYKDGKPVDIQLLDWQIIRHSSPVTDLMYLIFACTDSNFRRDHYEDLLNHYYETLENFLSKFSMEAQYIYPKSIFKSDLKKFSIFGLGMAVMTLLLFTCDAEDVPDLDDILDSKTKSTDFSKGNSAILYNSRINGVVSDYIKYGYM